MWINGKLFSNVNTMIDYILVKASCHEADSILIQIDEAYRKPKNNKHYNTEIIKIDDFDDLASRLKVCCKAQLGRIIVINNQDVIRYTLIVKTAYKDGSFEIFRVIYDSKAKVISDMTNIR